MHKRMPARDRGRVGVIAGVAVLAALVLTLATPTVSWAQEPDGSPDSASAAAASVSVEPPTPDGAPVAPSVEAAPADAAEEQQERLSAGEAVLGQAPGQESRPTAEERPVEEATVQEPLPRASADARQPEPALADAAAPGAGPAAIEPIDPRPAVPTSMHPSDASAAGAAAPAAVPVPQVSCLSTAFYAVTRDGVVQQVIDGAGTNDASLAPVGSWSLPSPAVDGLGVAAGGAAIYAVDVTRTGVDHVLVYTAAGGWAAVPSSFEHGNSEPLVAGAVDLATGRYYVGGYHVVDRTTVWFRVYSVGVGSGELALVGQLSTGLRPRDLSRGDMAFDGAGNLHVLHGSHDGGVVLTIAAAQFADPGPGGELAATASAHLNLNGLNEGNGIAFTPRGTAYISDPHHVRQFVPGTWSTPDNLVTVLHGSTDLASCNAPASFEAVPGVGPGVPGQPALPPATSPIPVVGPGSPGQPAVPPVANPVPVVGPGSPAQPAVPPVVGPISGAEPGEPGQPAVPPVVGPVPVVGPGSPGQPAVPPVVGPISGVEPGEPGQPAVPPVVGPISGVEPGEPGQPAVSPVVGPGAEVKPGASEQPVLSPVAGPLPGAEPETSQQPGRPPILVPAQAPVAEGPRLLSGTDHREREVVAERRGAQMTALPITGGGRQTPVVATGGLLLGSLGLLLMRRRRASRA